MVNSTGRLSPDEHSIAFESTNGDGDFLVVHEIASGTSRHVPRKAGDMGWIISAGSEIVWYGTGTGLLWLTDAKGANRRELLATEGRGSIEGRNLALAPDGESIAVLGSTREGSILTRVAIHGGIAKVIARLPASDGDVGVAGWGRNGAISLSRENPATGGTSLLRLTTVGGAAGSDVELPVACNPRTVTVAAGGRRAACLVPDRRADLILIDGLRP